MYAAPFLADIAQAGTDAAVGRLGPPGSGLAAMLVTYDDAARDLADERGQDT